jgi:hypothetical protein
MASLRELQQAFVDGVLSDRTAGICRLIARNGITPERRLGIYRNNASEGFLKTLEATFPVLLRLAGRDWIRQTGREYMRRHPSRSGNVHYIGERFAAFLAEQLFDSEYAYFADVARLEWSYQQILVAADHPSFDLTALAAVAPEHYPSLRFATHPALRLVSSAYPVLAIWKANRDEALDDAAEIRLDAGASRLMLIRREQYVELRELSPGDYALLYSFTLGEPLGDAAESALIVDPALDLGAALTRLVKLEVLVDFSTAGADRPGLPT